MNFIIVSTTVEITIGYLTSEINTRAAELSTTVEITIGYLTQRAK